MIKQFFCIKHIMLYLPDLTISFELYKNFHYNYVLIAFKRSLMFFFLTFVEIIFKKVITRLFEICFHFVGHRSSSHEFSAGPSEFLPDLHFLCKIVLKPSNVIPLLLFQSNSRALSVFNFISTGRGLKIGRPVTIQNKPKS